MKDYIVTAPGQSLLIVAADNVREARTSARQSYNVGKLPKGTQIEEYTEDRFARAWDCL